MTILDNKSFNQTTILFFAPQPTDITFVTEVLANEGHTLQICTTKSDLFQNKGQQIGLIFLASTFEEMEVLCQELSEKDTIPLLVVAPEFDATWKSRLLNAGATDYITPSLQPIDIVARINRYLRFQTEIYMLKEQVEVLEQTNTTLLKQNQEKDEFFAVVAHDLKSPFMPLLGASEFMAEMSSALKPDDVKEMSLSIYRSAKGLYKLLENLLQWSRLQQGKLEYQPDSFDLFGVVERNLQHLAHEADRKGINLYNQVDHAVSVYADEEMVDTILYNLIANGIKYTHKGGLVKIEGKRIDDTSLSLAVIDTGVGISDADRDRLFDVTEHYTTPGTDHESGMGLGLIITLQFVQQNKGTLEIDSEVGEGTTVSVTLPAAQHTRLTPEYVPTNSSSTVPDPTPQTITIEALTPPPEVTMHALLDFALAGDMEGIREQALQIEQMDDTLKPFATMLQQLAAGYQEQEILELVEHFIT